MSPMFCPYCVREVTFRLTAAGPSGVSDAPTPAGAAPPPAASGDSRDSVYRCPECNEVIPPMYVRDYRKCPPVVGNFVGFTGHGKTVLLASLLHELRGDRLARAWRPFHSLALDDPSLQTVLNNMAKLQQGVLPEATVVGNFTRPTLLRLANVPALGSSTLCFYDVGGEVFSSGQRIGQYARFLSQAKTVLFLVSLSTLAQQYPSLSDGLHHLLGAYVLGLNNSLHGDTRSQHLVVVYTKADELVGSYLASRPVLQEYIRHEDPNELRDPKKYLTRVFAVSQELHRFTEDELKAHLFLNTAQDSFASVSFAIVSALGASPDTAKGRLTTQIAPRRVMDPLMLMMLKGKLPVSEEEESDSEGDHQDVILRTPWTASRLLGTGGVIAAILAVLVVTGLLISMAVRSTSDKAPAKPAPQTVAREPAGKAGSSTPQPFQPKPSPGAAQGGSRATQVPPARREVIRARTGRTDTPAAPQGAVLPPRTEGQVTAVNRSGRPVTVTITLGERDGIRQRDQLTVQARQHPVPDPARPGALLGFEEYIVRVVSVAADTCEAALLDSSQATLPASGDTLTRGKPGAAPSLDPAGTRRRGVLDSRSRTSRRPGSPGGSYSAPPPPPLGTPSPNGRSQWVRPIRVTASSVARADNYRYDGPLAADGNPRTCWRCGEGDQEPWLEFSLSRPSTITGLEIINGWGLDHLNWSANARARQLLLDAGGGQVFEVLLEDAQEPQFAELPPTRASTLRVRFQSFYPGTARPAVCISEIQVRLGS